MAHMDGTWMSQMWWAMWILEERFARGEIDEDEFRSRFAALEGQR